MTERKRAREIIAQAQAQAAAIREQARMQAERIKLRARKDTLRMRQQVATMSVHAKTMRDNAVQLFRINLANTLTLFNGVAGFLSILASTQLHFKLAAVLILVGVLFDWLDGKAARAFGEESPLGKELDSLSDLITFGVAPAVLVAMIEPSLFGFGAAALFVLSAALRLGRFNVQELKGVFFGVPTTTNGILLPVLVFVSVPSAWFPWYLFIMAFLMNAPIRIKKVF